MTEQPTGAPVLEVDQRPRQLLEKYASLTGTMVLDTAEGLVEFEVPASEKRFWGESEVVRAALLTEALDEYPDAEILAVGSPLFERLVAAIRTRGYRESRGVVEPDIEPSPDGTALPIAVEGAAVQETGAKLVLVPVGRLLARVSIKAGAKVEERLAESRPVDFSTGQVLPETVVRALDRSAVSTAHPLTASAVIAPMRVFADLLPLMFSQLEEQLGTELGRLQDEATRSLATELQRLDQYYERMIADVEDEADANAISDAKQVFRAEQQRRRDEEEERHRVRITVHPLQICEWQVLAQRMGWRLTTTKQRTGELQGTRMLSGFTDWQIACPGCGSTPSALRVCREGHIACPACSEVCTVCDEVGCRTHGGTICAHEAHAVCAEHARRCPSCGTAICTLHLKRCEAKDHDVCPACTVLCARCGIALCRDHATHTGKDAPRGERWLCANCTVWCEGGTNEPVGADEAVRCTSCERHICEVHRVNCAVDDSPHCSRHLRRSDRSGRLVCEQHRAACADEPHSVLASDEVSACARCGRATCQTHGGMCYADHAHHCVAHLAAVHDRPGERGCEQHRSTCHVDSVVFSIEGTKPCAVCGKATCDRHRAICGYCARQACSADVIQGRCATCHQLADTPEPSDELVQAALAAAGGEPAKARGWRTAQDATGVVVEVNLGWTRKLVLTVLHGDSKPQHVVRHSILGTSRKR